MSIRNPLLTIVFALSAGMTSGVGAQGKVDPHYRQGHCSEDFKKFCARVKPGEARIANCMAEHFRELRPQCQGAITAARSKFDGLAKACKADSEKYCKGIRAGEGRILSCLKGRESDLSSACAAEFKRTGTDPAVTQ
jgi:hypothetical protein